MLIDEKYRLLGKDRRIKPFYFTKLEACHIYAKSRKSYEDKYVIHKFDINTGEWIEIYCSYEIERIEAKERKKESKVRYDQKNFYNHIENILNEEMIKKHFPKTTKGQRYIYIREITEELKQILKKHEISKIHFEYAIKITETCYKCYLKPITRIKNKNEALKPYDLHE